MSRLDIIKRIGYLDALGGGDGPPLSSIDREERAMLMEELNAPLVDDDPQLTPALILNPERRLWLDVIKTAFDDVTMKILDKDGNIDANNERIRNDARAWFTRASQDFRIICERASLHPDLVRAAGMERMAGS